MNVRCRILFLVAAFTMSLGPGGCQTALYPHKTWTTQTVDDDTSDRAHEVAGSSYFRNEWFLTFTSDNPYKWFERNHFAVVDETPRATIPQVTSNFYMQDKASIQTGTLGTSTPPDASTGYLKLTDVTSNAEEKGWLIISKGDYNLGNSFRIRAKVWAGSDKVDGAAGCGFGFYMMPLSEYNNLGSSSRHNWFAKAEGDFPHHGIGATINTVDTTKGFSVRVSTLEFSNTQMCDTATATSNGFTSCKATYGSSDPLPGINPCSCYKYCTTGSGVGCTYKPPVREYNRNDWDTFEFKINHTKVTLRYNGIDVMTPQTMPGIFESNSTDDWVFLIGASTSSNGAVDNHFIDDVEVSYWTQKRVPYPPKALSYVSATSSSVTIGWTPHEDDGGAPVRRYRIVGESVNQTCSADERSPLFNQSCTFYLDYSDCSTSAATCEVPNLRRATAYYIVASGINVVGEGPNMTDVGYGTKLVQVHPDLPEAPDAPVIVSEVGPTYAHLSWGKSPNNGGATVNGWAIRANASPAPPSPGSPNPTAVTPAIAYVFGYGITSFRLGLDQAYDVNNNPITVELSRWTNYTFQVAATNKYTMTDDVGASIEVGGLGGYTNATEMYTTPPKEPLAPTWIGTGAIAAFVWERPGHTGVEPLYPIADDTSYTVTPFQTCWWPCRMKLIWNAPTDDGGRRISSYRLFRGQEAGIFPSNYTVWESTYYEQTTTNATSWIVKGLIRDTNYHWKVAAMNELGEGPKSTTDVSARSLDYPDVSNMAYAQSTAQSSTQVLTGHAGNNVDWGSNGGSSLAVDGLTNPDFRMGQTMMTNIDTAAAPWWRVQFAQKAMVTELHLFMCSVYMPVTRIQLENCKSKYFKATLFEEIDGATETWSNSITTYTTTPSGSLDTGWRAQNQVAGIVDIRLTQQPSTSQIHPHFRLQVGSGPSDPRIGSMLELKSTIAPQKLAFAEVRVFGWKRGCNEEYTCNPSGGSCVARQWGRELRKCICFPGYYGETCSETAIPGPPPVLVTRDKVGRDMTAVYTSMLGVAFGVMVGVWFIGFFCMYAYYVLTGMGYSMGSAAVAPIELSDAQIRMKYVPGAIKANGQRVGGSSAARAMRKSQVARPAPSRGKTRQHTHGGSIEDVINPGQVADLSGQIGREPPCGMSVGLWRVVRDRWKFLLGLGAITGAVVYLIVVLLNVMADAKETA